MRRLGHTQVINYDHPVQVREVLQYRLPPESVCYRQYASSRKVLVQTLEHLQLKIVAKRRSLSQTEKSVEIRAPLPWIIGETRMMNREMVDQKNGVPMILCQKYDSHAHSRNTI